MTRWYNCRITYIYCTDKIWPIYTILQIKSLGRSYCSAWFWMNRICTDVLSLRFGVGFSSCVCFLLRLFSSCDTATWVYLSLLLTLFWSWSFTSWCRRTTTVFSCIWNQSWGILVSCTWVSGAGGRRLGSISGPLLVSWDVRVSGTLLLICANLLFLLSKVPVCVLTASSQPDAAITTALHGFFSGSDRITLVLTGIGPRSSAQYLAL